MSDIVFRFSKKLLGSKGAFTLEIDKQLNFGEFIALFGKSGAGKTSILRILSGLDKVDSGYIRVGNSVWLDSQNNIELPPQKRRIGFVFQNYALFPHLNVYENICFGLKDKQDKSFADELIALMDLQPLKKAHIHQLSGGQSQRVALARALTSRPTLLLLDEPFSALDNIMAQTLQNKLKTIHQHFNLTTLLVSHNLSEIFALASRTLIIKEGHIISDGNNHEIFIQKHLNAKIKLVGEIINISTQELICTISVLCNNEIFEIVYDPIEAATFKVGEQVIVASKAFNPMLYKIETSL
ncbi:ATP-binding cassette domain-containing protein [Helicobacter sp. MIT 21-1697]|uniref:ATP-binding cassette domain-containing protein n=1 Tax=Helicobacter sp. MIT 21-1697 TaxID=2993733 RepID=UPI00224B6DEE|nr:ATP-binding cassette domain-containing protein [Helicobacter sp. MIT 21-1697]MCX2716205.1 ATP-binding cassette domain-containing protein [Helicobacter sp. MIT 21-1697]